VTDTAQTKTLDAQFVLRQDTDGAAYKCNLESRCHR